MRSSIAHCLPGMLAACALALSAILAGCGTPGAPQPPSLQLPRPVDDLAAVRLGNKIYLRWTVPTQTSDEQGIKHLGVTRVCRDYRAQSCGSVVAEIPAASLAGKTSATATDDISALIPAAATDFVTYQVEVMNAGGGSAGPSNTVTAFLAPSLPPVSDFTASIAREGVNLHWSNPASWPESRMKTSFSYRLLRLAAGAEKPVTLAELSLDPQKGSYLDRTAEWDRSYEYRLAGVTKVFSRDGRQLDEFLGDLSPAAAVTLKDRFPPNAPLGLEASSSGTSSASFIDLTWSPNTDPDLAGYNIYRREAAAAANASAEAKLNPQIVATPAYRDATAQRGHEYIYTVTAVDTHGNEGPHSAPAQEKVPQ